ncbi:MAG: hypothetical protein Q9202_000597 [Teloschistes flavicans]
MSLRCPSSVYIGIARLPYYRWIINARGYANIVASPPPFPSPSPSFTSPPCPPPAPSATTSTTPPRTDSEDEVWGLIYTLTPTDEQRLDTNEGVPLCYTKEYMDVEFYPSTTFTSPPSPPSTTLPSPPASSKPAAKATTLIYIDRKRTLAATPKDEYIERMNSGIRDALEKGVPRGYVERVLRRFIPGEAVGGGKDGGVVRLAERQARSFGEEEEEGEGIVNSGLAT